MDPFVGKTRVREDGRKMLPSCPRGAGLFLELAWGASERLFAGLQHAGGTSTSCAPRRSGTGAGAVSRVGVRGRREERYHGRRAGMSHDLQFERRPSDREPYPRHS